MFWKWTRRAMTNLLRKKKSGTTVYGYSINGTTRIRRKIKQSDQNFNVCSYVYTSGSCNCSKVSVWSRPPILILAFFYRNSRMVLLSLVCWCKLSYWQHAFASFFTSLKKGLYRVMYTTVYKKCLEKYINLKTSQTSWEIWTEKMSKSRKNWKIIWGHPNKKCKMKWTENSLISFFLFCRRITFPPELATFCEVWLNLRQMTILNTTMRRKGKEFTTIIINQT